MTAADMLASFLVNDNLPLVRRIVQGLHFCSLLDESNLGKLEPKAWPEAMELFQSAAGETAGTVFRDRQQPSGGATALLRQIGVHYIRSHPGFPAVTNWRQRWRLMWMSTVFARGRGQVPQIHPGFSAATFEQLERPLGPLPASVTTPLTRYFEAQAVSTRYAVPSNRSSLTASFRSLSLTYPIALWLLRLAAGEEQPTVHDAIAIVGALDRGHGLPALSRAANALASTHQLDRLVAWYAR
jgi:hypothetical protein